MYKTPYPPAYDQIPLPHKYKLPDFTKHSGKGEVSTVEHIKRFIMQCGEVANQDALRVRLFSMSLSGSAFTWFTTLPANSILYWADLKKEFHQFFYSGVCDMKLTDLTSLGRGMINRLLRSSKDLEMSRIGVIVWSCLISSWQKLLSRDCCLISRKSMFLRNLTTSVKWHIE